MHVPRFSACHPVFRIRCAGLLLFVTAATLPAQSPSTRPADAAPWRTPVFPAESAEARRALEEALALKERGEIEQAVRAGQRVLEVHGDALLKSEEELYVPVARIMQSFLRNRDPDWVSRYREAYAEQARLTLERLGAYPAVQDLLEIARRWWLTPAGEEAAYRAAIRMHEAGQWQPAARILLELGSLPGENGRNGAAVGHPDHHRRADWWFALALLMGQDPDSPEPGSASTMPAFEKAVELDQPIWWRGRQRDIRDVWKDLEQLQPPEPETPERWPTWGGDSSQNRVATLAGEPLELLWTAETSLTWGAGRDWRAPGDGIGGHVSLPVSDGSRVFLQDANRVRAIGLHHGLTLWEHALVPDALDNAQQPMGASTRGPLAPAIHQGRVYAILGHERDNPFTQQREGWDSYLICLRADDGSTLWRLSAAIFARLVSGDGSAPPSNVWWWFDGSPLVHEHAVYTVIRRQQIYGVEDCYLARWDPLTGRCVWWTHVAGGNVGRGAGALMTRCDPAAHQDDLYVFTNLDALACVSGTTGWLNWIRAVPRDPARTVRESSHRPPHQKTSLHPLVVAPVSARTGRRQDTPAILVTTEPRTHDIIVLRSDGQLRFRILPETLGDPQTVLGPLDGVVYAVGREIIAFDLHAQRERWRRNLLGEGEALDGRPCLTDDALWIPTERALARVSLHDEDFRRWSWEELGLTGEAARQGGHLLALGDLLLSVRRTHVVAWACGKRALPLLEEVTSQRPDSPDAQLSLARYHLLNAGDWDEGWEALQRVVQMAADAEFHPYGDTGRRGRLDRLVVGLMNDAIVGMAGDPTKDVEQVRRRLAHCSEMLAEMEVLPTIRHATWEAMARLMEQRHAWPQAVQFWQHIVRATPPEDEFDEGSSRRRALDAQARILETHGREPFAAYNRQATRLLEASSDLSVPERRAGIIENYRYAAIAPTAMLDQADRYAQEQDRRRAQELYLLAWHRYGPDRSRHWPQIDTTVLIASIVRSAMAEGDHQRAAYWCAVGRTWLNRATVESEERQGPDPTLEQMCSRFRQDTSLAHPVPPRTTPPFERKNLIALPPGSEVLMPDISEHPALESEFPDWWLMVGDGRWQAWLPTTGEALWQRDDDGGPPPQHLFLDGKQALLTSPYRWLSLDRQDGSPRWVWGQTPPTYGAPQVDPEIWRRLVDTAWNDLWIAGVWDDGVMELIRKRDGRRLWQRRSDPPFRRPLAMGELFIAYASRKDNQTAIVCLDLFSGRHLRTIERPDDRLIHAMRFTRQGHLLVHGSDWFACYDPRDGRSVWSQDLTEDRRITRILPYERLLYLVMHDGSIEARTTATGRLQWAYSSEGHDRAGEVLPDAERGLYVVRAGSIELLETLRGTRRATLEPPAESVILQAWITRDGPLALCRLNGQQNSPIPSPSPSPAPHVLCLWPGVQEHSFPATTREVTVSASVELGEFTRFHKAELADRRFTLHADNTLITWSNGDTQ